MNYRQRIFDIIKFGLSFKNMPNISSFPQLTESHFTTNKGCFLGLITYFTIVIDRLTLDQRLAYYSKSDAYSHLSRIKHRYQNLIQSPLIWKLRGNNTTPHQFKRIIKELIHAKYFYYSYKDYYIHNKDLKNQFRNKNKIVSIEGIKFMYDSHNVSLNDILKVNIPLLDMTPSIKSVDGFDSEHQLVEY